MRLGRPVFFLVVALGTIACSPGIGSSTPCAAGMEPFPAGTVAANPRCPDACDPVAARAVVYDVGGGPSYAGQALLAVGCSASYCHTGETNFEGADTTPRNGAPAGLDFVSFPGASAPGIAEANRVHGIVVEQRGGVWDAVSSGSMPPGETGREIVAEASPYHWQGPTGPALAGLDTAESREILRNWLACGAPFVDRTDLDGTLATCPAGATCSGDYVASVAIP